MPSSLRSAVFLLLCLFGLAGHAHALDVRKEGAELTAAFYERRVDVIWARMSPQMQAALQSKENFAAFREQLDAQLGAETAVVEETTGSEQGVGIYVRKARFEKVPMVIVVQWAIDADGVIAGFFIRPDQSAAQTAAPSEHLDYTTRTPLRLPFADEMFVFWGGREIEQNYHAAHSNQRFALDLLMMRDGKSHTGDGARNEDYHCFGKPILAPADGVVVEVVDGVADNVPGRMNPQQVTGNRVILDHGNDEYSVLAHLRDGTVQVAKGDTVKAGDRLGDCGNSGNSSEPHLHYQLQAGPVFGTAVALPAQFTLYVADDQPVERGEPVRGQRIRPATPH